MCIYLGRWKRETESDVYYEIAEATGGKVYQINTLEIAEVMKHITQVGHI